MPLYCAIEDSPTVKVVVWEITETVHSLRAFLEDKGVNLQWSKMPSNEKKLKQWLAVRVLLFQVFDHCELKYDEEGKPFIDQAHHISISHSGRFVVVMFNKKEACGVDIQEISDKVVAIKHKFLNDEELARFPFSDEESTAALTTMWGAKEAIFKAYGKQGVFLKEHIELTDVDNLTNLTGWLAINQDKKRYQLTSKRIEDFTLVYTS